MLKCLVYRLTQSKRSINILFNLFCAGLNLNDEFVIILVTRLKAPGK